MAKKPKVKKPVVEKPQVAEVPEQKKSSSIESDYSNHPKFSKFKTNEGLKNDK